MKAVVKLKRKSRFDAKRQIDKDAIIVLSIFPIFSVHNSSKSHIIFDLFLFYTVLTG